MMNMYYIMKNEIFGKYLIPFQEKTCEKIQKRRSLGISPKSDKILTKN